MSRTKEQPEERWREKLSSEQFDVCFRSATEPPFSGEYHDCKDTGTYRCVACETPVFESLTKFDSGTGWPSFFQPAEGANVEEHTDQSHGMIRTEVKCGACGAHLGHVFPDGPAPTGLRYCINSLALKLDREPR